MACRSTFLRMGNDADENAETVLDFVAHQLELRSIEAKSTVKQLGNGVARAIRPWAMLCTHNHDVFENVLRRKAREIYSDGRGAEQRQWLDGIRICGTETIHQLRAVLCTIHIQPVISLKEKQMSTDLLTWIVREKDGQPPCLVVVHNLLDLLVTAPNVIKDNQGLTNNDTEDRRFLRVRFDHLTHTLSLLLETCDYLSSQARETWEQPFQGLATGWTTDLLVTDSGCVPNHPVEIDPQLKSLYRIIEHYFGHIV